MIGTRVVVTRATHTGTETILGHIVAPMMVEGEGKSETITHVTVEGTVTVETVRGLALPIEPEREVRMELIPLESRHPRLLAVEVLT